MNVGIDVIEIDRFRDKPLNNDNASFYHSIFTESELSYCMKYSDPYPHIAGIFAAKESVLKCLTRPVKMSDMEISHNRDGKPKITVHSMKTRSAKSRISISITHTRSIAIAVATTD